MRPKAHASSACDRRCPSVLPRRGTQPWQSEAGLCVPALGPLPCRRGWGGRSKAGRLTYGTTPGSRHPKRAFPKGNGAGGHGPFSRCPVNGPLLHLCTRTPQDRQEAAYQCPLDPHTATYLAIAGVRPILLKPRNNVPAGEKQRRRGGWGSPARGQVRGHCFQARAALGAPCHPSSASKSQGEEHPALSKEAGDYVWITGFQRMFRQLCVNNTN